MLQEKKEEVEEKDKEFEEEKEEKREEEEEDLKEVPVDVGEVGHVTGRHDGVEELHGLHGRDGGQPAQQGGGDKQGGAL